jgi:hypothetical protein
MNTHKKVIILGTHTIFSDKYFVNDEVPRVLGTLIEDGFKIELLKVLSDDVYMFENTMMPFWLRENILIIDNINEAEKLHKDSFVITDNAELAKTFNFSVPVYTDFFNSLTFDKFNNVDLLVCFGFSSKEFKHFCKSNNVLGFKNGVILDRKIQNYNAVAVSTDEDNTEDTADYAISKFKLVVNNQMYKVKHNNTLIGLTYKGRGINNEIGYLPLLFI